MFVGAYTGNSNSTVCSGDFSYLRVLLRAAMVGSAMATLSAEVLNGPSKIGDAVTIAAKNASPVRLSATEPGARTDNDVRFYGVLLALFALFAVGLFFFLAYHAFGGVGVIIALSVLVIGLCLFTTFIARF